MRDHINYHYAYLGNERKSHALSDTSTNFVI